MRELDTEAPVVWPAWCYQSGKSIKENFSKSNTYFFFIVQLSWQHDELLIIDFFLYIIFFFFNKTFSYVAFDLNTLLMSLYFATQYYHLN